MMPIHLQHIFVQFKQTLKRKFVVNLSNLLIYLPSKNLYSFIINQKIMQIIYLFFMIPFCDGLTNSTGNQLLAKLQNINTSDLSTWVSAKPAVSRLFQRSYPKFGPPQPTNLKVSFDEAPAEHMVFLFGIFMLISMVIICTVFLMKMTKASGVSAMRGTFGAILPSNYPMVLWMPKTEVIRHHRVHHQRHTRPSLMVLLRSSFSCTNNATGKHQRARYAARGRSCVSVVSSSSMNPLLPHSLTITPSPSTGSAGLVGSSSATTKIAPPPPYEEFEGAKE